MAYLCKADRRAGIIEAAIDIILTQSLAAATVRAVASALGASPGQIHHHFGSVDELRAEALLTLWGRVTPDCEARLTALPPRERLAALLIGDDPGIEALTTRLMDDALIASDSAPAVRAAVRQLMDGWLAMIVQTITEGQAAGAFADCDDVPELARRLAALSIGTDTLARVEVDGHSRDAVRARLGACVDLLLPPPRHG